MQVQLYRNTSERIVLDKELTDKKILSMTLKDSTNILNPVLLVTIDNPLLDLFPYNYLTISNLARSYYIDEIVQITNKLWELHCSVDVIGSFKNYIKAQTGVVSFTQTNPDKLITNTLVTRVKDKFEIINSVDPVYLHSDGYEFGEYAMITLQDVPMQESDAAIYYFNTPTSKFFRNPNSGINYQGVCNFKYLVRAIRDLNDDNTFYNSLEYFLDTVRKDDTKYSKIISVRAYPFNINAFKRYIKEEPYFDTTHSFVDGQEYGIDLDNSGNPKYSPISMGDGNVGDCKGIQVYNTVNRKIVDEFIKIEIEDTYLNYPPYRKYYLYLPYYGKIELDLYLINNKYLHVQYIIDWDTGYTTIFVSAEDSKTPTDDIFNDINHVKLLYQLNIMLGVDIPLNTTNLADIECRKAAIDTQYTGQMINTLLSGLGSVITGGAQAVAGAAMLGASTTAAATNMGGSMMASGFGSAVGSGLSAIGTGVANEYAKEAQKSVLVETGSINGNLGNVSTYYGPSSIILYSISKDVVAPTQYGPYTGYSVEKEMSFNDLVGTGFNKIEYVHLQCPENLAPPTYKEVAEIENMLKNGIIF